MAGELLSLDERRALIGSFQGFSPSGALFILFFFFLASYDNYLEKKYMKIDHLICLCPVNHNLNVFYFQCTVLLEF